MKFGVGNWLAIVGSGCLPGKTPSQMSMQTQRMFGQQSIREFMKIHLDTDLIWQKNQTKTGEHYVRKGGVLINTGSNRTREWFLKRLEKNIKRYQLPRAVVDSIVLPDRSSEALRVELSGREKVERLHTLKRRLERLEEALSRKRSQQMDDEVLSAAMSPPATGSVPSAVSASP